MRIAASIEYAGQDFSGWQKQPKIKTIQGEIEKAIFSITNENIEITEVRPDGISFRFGSDGSASARGIGLHEIPKEWIDYFMYTDAEVAEARAKAK